MNAISVAIADDHPVVLELLDRLLERTPPFRVTHTCRSGTALIAALMQAPVDIAVVDYSMSRGERPLDGLLLLRKLRSVAPRMRCVMFTAQSNPSVLAAALRLGVAAIVSKEDPIDEIVRACRRLDASGRCYLSPAIRATFERGDTGTPGRESALTARELDVVRLFASGHTLQDIAKQLGRSVSTVSTQKHTAMRKLQADTNIHLIRYAYENGLI
ncbi:response regulator transcription factor [Burkholderia stagnalis]|uniref:DNA-binding response regulator n=1 Tax=Burkholderia stagnalis TaxID=1503054 RepID=A0A108GBG9_9BURK|nr:response regulator transcription factor [Burkholderia stagnalis]KVZ11128.1 two-component system response regulator [Burkholderia stagnalis]KWA55535.1 two-component system response regulator [Burkholderia stagnalis]KWA56276.1 two-component system response regulator [Burkholderia stagnalis]KWA56585.1 two-component system response regulator [Burkholderia stagnalis]KWC95566.1 two-component system response regulator [Burkholderia stagnalis]